MRSLDMVSDRVHFASVDYDSITVCTAKFPALSFKFVPIFSKHFKFQLARTGGGRFLVVCMALQKTFLNGFSCPHGLTKHIFEGF